MRIGQQLVALLKCALREIELSRNRSILARLTADSLPPNATPTIYEVVERGSGLEVVSCTDATSSAAEAPATGADPSDCPTLYFGRTVAYTTTTTQVTLSTTPPKK